MINKIGLGKTCTVHDDMQIENVPKEYYGFLNIK